MSKTFYWTFIVLTIGVFGGIALGMLMQQAIIQSTLVKVATGLEGTTFNIEVDINETLMVDRITDNLEEMGVFNYTPSTGEIYHFNVSEDNV